MDSLVDVLLLRTWWSYDPRNGSLHSVLYRNFNLVEGTAWCVFATLVMRRYLHHRRSPLEVWYALAFLLFGMTDFREAWALQSWLLWIKLANLIALCRLRRIVIRKYYPESNTY